MLSETSNIVTKKAGFSDVICNQVSERNREKFRTVEIRRPYADHYKKASFHIRRPAVPTRYKIKRAIHSFIWIARNTVVLNHFRPLCTSIELTCRRLALVLRHRTAPAPLMDNYCRLNNKNSAFCIYLSANFACFGLRPAIAKETTNRHTCNQT